MAGYIKLHRGWHDSPMFGSGPYCERAAWAWLLSNAAWKDTQRRTPAGLITLERGQIHVSLRSLASAWKWSKGKVERFLDVLETGQSIGQQTGHGGRILTICSFNEYQGSESERGTPSGTPSGTRTGQGRDTQEEGKERKEDKGAAFPKPDWADESLWADFLKNRKTKRLTNSATAYDRFERDIEKWEAEGYEREQLLRYAVERGWGAIFEPKEEARGQVDHDDPDGKYWWKHDRAAGARG